MQKFIIYRVMTMHDGTFFTLFENFCESTEEKDTEIIRITNHYNNERIQNALKLLGCRVSLSVTERL